jgi:hypothetical protein
VDDAEFTDGRNHNANPRSSGMRYAELGEITTFANTKNQLVFGIGWTREEQEHIKFALPPGSGATP